MCQPVAQVYDLLKHRATQMADEKILKLPHDKQILEILDSAGMGVEGMWLVRAAFPKHAGIWALRAEPRPTLTLEDFCRGGE